MGLFAGKKMNKHSASGGGVFLPWKDAEYLVRIKRCLGRKGYKGESAIVEFEIVRSNNPDVEPGQSFSWINKLEKGDVVLGNISDFVRTGIQTMEALDGRYIDTKRIVPDLIPSDEDFDNEVENVYGEDNPFAGLELIVKTLPIKTQGKGDPFTKHVWSTPEELLEEVKAGAGAAA